MSGMIVVTAPGVEPLSVLCAVDGPPTDA